MQSASPEHESTANVEPAVNSEHRLGWLDVMRSLMVLEIVGFHWLRTAQENGRFDLFFSEAYDDVGRGFGQLNYLLIDQTGLSISSVTNNLIGIAFGYGWEAVNVFVLLSGVGLALSYRPDRPRFSIFRWYRRRFSRILVPFYIVALPMVIVGKLFMDAETGRGGVLGAMATKLSVKNLPDPLWIEIAKHVFLVDPRQDFWTCQFFSPAWWFIPPLLVAYLAFPIFYRLIARFRISLIMPAAAIVSILSYYSLAAGWLVLHAAYFIVLNECFSFTAGIAVGRLLQAETGREKCYQFLSSTRCAALGAILFAVGNVTNWFTFTHPFASPIFTTGFSLLLAYLALQLTRLSKVLSLSRLVDNYYIYLVHQCLAFPLVVLTVAAFGGFSRRLGFSVGFLVYVLVVFCVALIFQVLLRRFEALGRFLYYRSLTSPRHPAGVA